MTSLKRLATLHSQAKNLALQYMRDAAHITLCDGDKLAAWIGVYGGGHEAVIDVAVLPEYRKRWATPNLVRSVFKSLFDRGIKNIKITSSQTHVIKAAHKLGFKMDEKEVSEGLHTRTIALVLNHEDYLRKYRMRERSI